MIIDYLFLLFLSKKFSIERSINNHEIQNLFWCYRLRWSSAMFWRIIIKFLHSCGFRSKFLKFFIITAIASK